MTSYNNNMFDEDAVYPIQTENEFILQDDPDAVYPEVDQTQPTFTMPLLSISDNLFDKKLEYTEPFIARSYDDDSFNIKFSNFASEVYEDRKSRRSMLLNHKYIDTLSNKNISTYVDEQDKSLVISLRGTVTTDVNDIASDIAIIAGDKTVLLQRLADYKKIIEKAIEKFPEYNVVLTGHSLGAVLVEELLKDYDEFQGIVFNPATSLSQSNISDQQENLIGYRSTGDPISLGYTSIPLKTIRSKFNLDRHSILNFIDRDNSNILD